MIGSLFSGIGGLELGLESLGLGPVAWQCDSDPAARAVLAARWPGVKRYSDVREIDDGATRVSLICGGFPCQPHSVAGRRKGTADARWLWPEFKRVLWALRPEVVFVENVPGLRTSGLRNVLADLAQLGLDAEWGLYSAAEVGAPHRRSRLFILAYPSGKPFRLQPGRGGRAGGQETPLPGSHGVAGPMAHARSEGDHPWAVEPDVGRVAHGVPAREHRLRLLGNACVPQQAAHAFQDLMARALS